MNNPSTIRIPVETRFPVELGLAIEPINRLYEEAKHDLWSPEDDIDWSAFDAVGFSAQELDAARRVWSRRAWLEYSGIPETPALLIRFCLERGREADAKYFLTVRNTEEAELLEAFYRYAECLGGYHPHPPDARWEEVINRGYYRDALNADIGLDSYVAVHCAFENGLELALLRAALANATESLAKRILARAVRDKTRHAEFGWQYLAARVPRLTAEEKAAVTEAIRSWIEQVAFSGYHVASLASAIDSTDEQKVQGLTAKSGLGAATAAQEEQVFGEYLSAARRRLQGMGLDLPAMKHPRLGNV